MKVKALKDGYFIQYRNAGEIFEIEEKQQLGSWMELLEEEKPKRVAKKKSSTPEAADDFLD